VPTLGPAGLPVTHHNPHGSRRLYCSQGGASPALVARGMLVDMARFCALVSLYQFSFIILFYSLYRYSLPDSFGTTTDAFFTMFDVRFSCVAFSFRGITGTSNILVSFRWRKAVTICLFLRPHLIRLLGRSLCLLLIW
jgi:hypothetical protein